MRKKFLQTAKIFCLTLVTAVGVLAGASTVKAGDSFNTANPVSVGSKTEMDYSSSTAPRYYKFTTDNKPGYYLVNFGKYGAAQDLIIYEGPNASYTKILEAFLGDDGNADYYLSLKPNYTYFIECSPREPGGKGYFILTKINDDYGNTLGNATKIPLNQTTTGNIEVNEVSNKNYSGNRTEIDTLCFTTTGNDSFYEIALSCTGEHGMQANIYEGPDESYNNVYMYTPSGDTRYYSNRLTPNKTYYVKLYSAGGAYDQITSYKLSVTEIKDDAGSDFSDATKLTNQKSLNKTLQVDYDVDFFKFKNSLKDTGYEFYFKNRSKNGMTVTIYQNNDIASPVKGMKDMYIASGSSRKCYLTLKGKRTYYVKVTSDEGNVAYTLYFKDLNAVVKKAKAPSLKANGAYKSVSLTFSNKFPTAVYEIYRSTSKNSGFKKIKTLKNQTSDNVSYVNRVKSKKTYYYKMRYYILHNGKKVYSKWSKVKRAKSY